MRKTLGTMVQKKILLISIPALLALFFTVGSVACSISQDSTENIVKNKYNIVVIVSDALRSDVLGCYGGDAKTPNIDRLAASGTLFDNAFSTAPCTMPSSVSMLTGSYSRSYGLFADKKYRKWKILNQAYYVNDNEALLGKELKKAGYHLRYEIENMIALRSNNFQQFKECLKMKKMTQAQINQVERITGIKNIGFHPNHKASSKYNRLYGVLHYLLTVPETQPFFMVKWFSDPHAQYHPPKKFLERIDVDPARLRKPIDYYLMLRGKKRDWRRNSTEYEHWFLKELYKAEVESVDERVGFIIKALEYRGFCENTIVVFTSDHGEMFGEHGYWGHGYTFHQEVLHIPLIFAGPSIAKGKRISDTLSLLDLMPTLKEMIGITYQHNMQGKSFFSLFSGRKIPVRPLYFGQISNNFKSNKIGSDALIMDNQKLIVTKHRGKPTTLELYNLLKDPGETNNIIGKEQKTYKKLFNQIHTTRQENLKRLKKNLARIGKDVDMEKEGMKTFKELKSLGYIN